MIVPATLPGKNDATTFGSISTNGAGASFFPGNAAGTITPNGSYT